MATGTAYPAVTAGTPAPRGSRRRSGRAVGIAVVLALVVAASIAVGVGGSGGRQAAQVCGADGTGCVPLLTKAASTPRWALLPIGSTGRLEVRNAGLTGAVGIGLAGYLGADPATLLPTTTTTGTASLAAGATAAVGLTGVPEGARLALVRTDGVTGAATCSGTACDTLHVGVRTVVEAPSASVLARLIDRRPSVTTAVARKAATTVADELHARATAPAHLTAAIRPGRGRLTVDWVLTTGGEDVSAVQVSIRPEGSSRAATTHDAIAATGSLVLQGLDRTTPYVVEVAPVVGTGGAQVVGAAVQLTATPDGAPAATGETTPSAPAGWTPLISQDFSKPAPLGTFADVYPGWSWYDGMTETSRETARPRSEVGVWDSATTMQVEDGMLDCHLHTAGKQPQVCALTPTPDEDQWHGQLYGRYSVRFRTDAVPGYKIAWLLWPDSNDWSQGEIDFPEASLDGSITGSSHRNDGDPSDFAWFVDTATSTQSWHTATIDWEPGRLTFLLDGESWTTTDPAALPRVPMRWTLQAETAIQDQAPDPRTQGHIFIDWVAAWSRSG